MLRFSVVLVIMLGVLSVSYSDSNGIWTYPRDIKPGIFGEDESTDYVNDNYTFMHRVFFNGRSIFNYELVGNDRVTLNDILYTTSNIGIGVVNPSQRLEVSGNISANQFSDRDNSAYYVNPYGSSRVQIVYSDAYYSYGSTVYYVDPKDTSRLNILNTDILQIKGQNVDDRFVNEGQINSINSKMITDNSITSQDVLDNSLTANDLGVNSVGSSETIDGSITLNDVDINSLDDTFATKDYVDSNSNSGGISCTTVWSRGQRAYCPPGYIVTGCSAGMNKGSSTHYNDHCYTHDYNTDWTEARCCK